MPIDALFCAEAPVVPFLYTDAKGYDTQRSATPVALTLLKNGEYAMRALCALRGAPRTFSLHRLHTLHTHAPSPSDPWPGLSDAIIPVLERLKQAEAFTHQAAHARTSDPVWAERMGAPVGLAWRGEDGIVRLDPQADWSREPEEESRHAILARRAARNRAATAFLDACPPGASMGMVWEQRAGYRMPGKGWVMLP